MSKFIRLAALATAMVVASPAVHATVYDFKFVDTISAATTPGISVGDVVTLHLFADNGGSTLVSQTWFLPDLQGFTIQAGTYSATYSKVFESGSPNFTTDASGTVTNVQFYGTSNLSNNTDNFGSWTGDYVFGNAIFDDFLGRQNSISAGSFTNPRLWTVSAVSQGVPEPATWALMLGGFGAIGGVMRSRKKAAVSFA